ncbi:MAG: MalY/PatB family protein [Anaerolineales bacterium]
MTAASYDFDRLIDRRSTNSLKWRRYEADVLPLWVADMDFSAPPPVLEALRQAVEHGVFGYAAPTVELAETVAGRMQRLYGWRVTPEMVVATPGVVSAFAAAARAVCQPGQGILIQPPIYPPFLSVHATAGLVRQDAPLVQVSHSQYVEYEIDWEIFDRAFRAGGVSTGMFLLCNPHNPTGQIYSPQDLGRMADLCLRHGALICSDEIHSELLLGGSRHTPIAALDPAIAARTITLIAPSKTFNIAGLFCGFAIIPDEDLRIRYRKALEMMTLHVNSLGLVAAQAAFSGACDDWLVALNRYLTANRDDLADFVGRRLPGVRTTFPSATYLAWLDCTDLIRTGRIQGSPHQFFLQQARVALNEGAEFGPGGEGFVRLNFGCPRVTLTEALERMAGALDDLE